MEANRIRKIVFDNEITLWWERVILPQDGVFEIAVNGKIHGKTTKTHYRLLGLSPETVYRVDISIVDHGGAVVEEFGAVTVKTVKAKKFIDVTKAPYFAVGNGKTINTVAIQRALDDCGADESVYIPAGVFLTGALDVHSDTEIYLEKGSVLQGTTNVKDYAPKRWSRFEGIEMECYASLINIGKLDHKADCTTKNIIFRGYGTISGGGVDLAWAIIDAEKIRMKTEARNFAEANRNVECEFTIPGRARGRLISVNNCQNVIFSGITMQNGPAWNIHTVYSKNITACHCKILSKGVWNGDGWDPDSSENCVVFDTDFETHDDAIAIKSGKNPEGNIVNRPAKNIYAFDCRGSNGITIGSEMSGGVENVYIWDCDMGDAYSGFTVRMPKERGGFIRNVHISNCRLATLYVLTKINFNNDGQSAQTVPVFEDFFMENIEVIGISIEKGVYNVVSPIKISGFSDAEPIRNVKLNNILLHKRANGELPDLEIKHVENFVVDGLRYE